jgi:hypothetical protein
MKKILSENYYELAVFLMDYHSGQHSRGYRLLCRLDPRNFSATFCEEMRHTYVYNYLVATYKDKV